jgi:glycerate kinase
VHVVAAPDKFKGTLTATEAAAAIGRAAARVGWSCDEAPMADGGEGTVEALGGANRTTTVSGPIGDPVAAPWRLARRTAVIEMSAASGLELVGGPDGNDPIAASTYGTGELISVAAESGAQRIVIGLGGSATTDGGLGALRAMYPLHRFRGVEMVLACDVRTTFVDAAPVFAPQKGATPAQVKLLVGRLQRLAQVYLEEHAVDVRDLEGSGAAGGLAGALAAVGAEIAPGFELVSEEVDLDERLGTADLVVTGEGFMDEESFDGKVVGGVAELASGRDIPALAVVGAIYDGVEDRIDAVSLTERFGEERSRRDTAALLEEVVAERLTDFSRRRET